LDELKSENPMARLKKVVVNIVAATSTTTTKGTK